MNKYEHKDGISSTQDFTFATWLLSRKGHDWVGIEVLNDGKEVRISFADPRGEGLTLYEDYLQNPVPPPQDIQEAFRRVWLAKLKAGLSVSAIGPLG